MSTKPSFFAELKRRHVYRVAIAYAVTAWLLQLAAIVLPTFGAPHWVLKVLIGVFVIFFPVAILLAWAFEVTPEGVRHTLPESEEPVPTPARRRAGRRIDFAIIAILVAAVAVLAWRQFMYRPQANLQVSGTANIAHAPAGTSRAAALLPQAATAIIPAKSIAVLPFVNLSGDPKQVYFSDGITEEILNALAQIPDLKVAGRTSAFQFNNKNEDLRKVGEVLGVATVLEGSVQKAGDEVRITVQLVDTRSGYQLWSENYDRKLTNIFAIEDEISNAIAGKLRAQWSGGASRPLVAQQTIDPRAHDFYLRGLALLAARGPGLRDAVATFQSALKIAPDYAQAWGALAETQALLPSYFLEPADIAYSAAQISAQRALSISPNVSLAYVALGYVYRAQWKWMEADAAFHRALKLAPSDAETINQYGQFLLATGQLDRSLAELERARRLDPLSGIIAVERIGVLTALHRFDDAAAQIQNTILAYPQYALARFMAADVAIYRHHYPEAEVQLRVAAKLVGQDPQTYTPLVEAITDPSKRPAALYLLKTVPADARWGLAPYPRIWRLAILGDRDGALAALERVSPGLIPAEYIFWQPAFDPIRNDPRFKDLLKKMGLPYTPKALSPARAAYAK
ncbi:MAG: hypothetical protein ACRES7_09020 [Gammaproteobacteria bacterium]